MKSASIARFVSLRNALLQERTQLETRLVEISRALGARADTAPATIGSSGKRTFSAATKAKMAAAQQARWAKLKAKPGSAPVPAPKKKRTMSAAGRANIIAAVKARWAKAKALKAKSGA